MVKTNIEWCDFTWSPWLGCSKVSAGCKNCYIVTTMPFRTRKLLHGQPRQRTSVSYWKQPLSWQRQAVLRDEDVARFGTRFQRQSVFPSLCDWLDDEVPIEWLADFLQLIYQTPNLDWLLLTKRPDNFFDRIHAALTNMVSRQFDSRTIDWVINWRESESVPTNVWIGVSVENQEMADLRIPQLLEIPAAVRFLSAEPLLDKMDLLYAAFNGVDPLQSMHGIDWVIVGGESGAKARPCNVEWVRDVVSQCKAAGVCCFVKQLGSNPIFSVRGGLPGVKHPKGGDMAEWPEDLRVRQFPEVSRRGAEVAEVAEVGK